MAYITYKSDSNTIGQCLFGATDYNNNKLSGYGVSFGKQHYLHKILVKMLIKFNNFGG